LKEASIAESLSWNRSGCESPAGFPGLSILLLLLTVVSWLLLVHSNFTVQQTLPVQRSAVFANSTTPCPLLENGGGTALCTLRMTKLVPFSAGEAKIASSLTKSATASIYNSDSWNTMFRFFISAINGSRGTHASGGRTPRAVIVPLTIIWAMIEVGNDVVRIIDDIFDSLS
jgi:hypothetical protein